LLQPQDRRAREPGDSREAVDARRRLVEAGLVDPLLAGLLALPCMTALPAGAPVLDVGCGEGSVLRVLTDAREVEAWGVDLSRPAAEAAARRCPRATILVANADRGLPFAEASFALVLCVTSRLPAAELSRVLRRDGRLVVVVAGPDDLVELREAVQGERRLDDRAASALATLAGHFEVVERESVRRVVRLDAARLGDVLTSTYRSGRARVAERLARLPALDVTTSWDLVTLRGISAPPGGTALS
jgi:23S rRNA (guanine745-N1)-methyltransferase